MRRKPFVLTALAAVVAIVSLFFPPTASAVGESISVSPSSGPPGATVIVTGAGWEEHGSRHIDVPIMIGGEQVADPTPDASGTFRIAVTIPRSATGSVVISAIIGNGGSADVIFKVNDCPTNPTMATVPRSGTVGSKFIQKGNNWLPGGTVRITLPHGSKALFLTQSATPRVGPSGGWQTVVTVGKGTPPGTYSYTATERAPQCPSGKISITGSFTVCPTNPTMATVPKSGTVGSKFIQKGNNWLPGGTVRITLPHGSKALFLTQSATPRVGPSGGWQTVVTVGKGTPPGTYSYTATERAPQCPSGKISITGSFTVR
ncbi:hypothetical protein [Streptomyces sp. HUAS ZL42]|uniref:hypothetical protein n=1 Tax=Streptomyces sp. HUAS ZL42 TaxID=3231715 RepID=UPI00345E50EE